MTTAVALFVICLAAGIAGSQALRHQWPFIAGLLIGAYFLFAIKVAKQWEKVAVLRLGRHELAQMVGEREMLGRELQRILDEKTNPWGITVQSVEIRDVQIPASLASSPRPPRSTRAARSLCTCAP